MKQLPIREDVVRQALEWMVELQSSQSGQATREAWSSWHDADPEHARAWQRIEAFGERFGTFDGPARRVLSRAGSAPADSPQRRQAIKTLLVLAVASGAAWTVRERTPWPSWTADIRTTTGERRHVSLGHGIELQLNGATALDFDAERRQLYLRSGEVLVDTLNVSSARPLQVICRDGQVSVERSRFCLGQFEHGSRLGVYAGEVTLRAAGVIRQVGPATTLRFDQLRISPARPAGSNDLAWLEGMLVVDGVRLGDLLQDLQRYRHGYLGCAQSIADLRVSGTYPLADTDRVLEALAGNFDLRLRRFTRYWATLEPKA
ncbi:FecR domain-containing protein [Pseudomonas sp. LRF_L74]|uniref:FecR domain-containing protein n=1 Tax=Pseudomonas sp. LRF_L74 TaxID=3369422 RepID=UPI003F5E941F